MDEDDEYLLKVLVVGDVAVGKTSIIERFANDVFREDYKTTIGVEFSLNSIEVDGKTANVQLWDIAGQERFIGLLRNYYRDATAAIVVYDISQPKTFQNTIKWKADIDRKVKTPDGFPIPCILMANKGDLRETHGDSMQFISTEESEKLRKEHGFLGTIETSAKTGSNVKRACVALVKRALKDIDVSRKKRKRAAKKAEGTVTLTSEKKSQDSCC